MKQRSHIKAAVRALAIASIVALSCILCACSSDGESSKGSTGSASNTSGPAFSSSASANIATCDFSTAIEGNNAAIDVSRTSDGCVWAKAVNGAALKFQILKDDNSYNFDMPNDGTPTAFPLNMGDGAYKFRVMQNTGGNNYVEVLSASADVTLSSEFAPFLQPNVFCSYDDSSQCVVKARELADQAQNEGDFVRLVYEWITTNVSYDSDKAKQLTGTGGYVPDPDETFTTGKGICFDYASLGAAMMRSQGIPCKIMTGYVSPDGIYHSWNMVFIDGSWKCAEITVSANTWVRIDLTFAASGADASTVGDGSKYTDRYTY